jgi:hypothetical protein
VAVARGDLRGFASVYCRGAINDDAMHDHLFLSDAGAPTRCSPTN